MDTSDEETHRTRFRVGLVHDLPYLKNRNGHWKFWVHDEIFYDWDVSLVNQNRLAAGVTIPVCKDLDLSVGGQWRTRRNGRDGESWDDDHMILLNLRYKLPNLF